MIDIHSIDTELTIDDVWFPCDFIMPPECLLTDQGGTIGDEVCVKFICSSSSRWPREIRNGTATAFTYCGKWYQIPDAIIITHWKF